MLLKFVLILTLFLAHLIDFYQMCYCCRKLENRPQCTESASMYGIGLNVQLSDWLCLNVHQSESCTLRLIPYIEADSDLASMYSTLRQR